MTEQNPTLMEQYVSEQEYDSVAAEETTPVVDPTLEDQYGEPNDGPDVEENPRLDAEVTDEDTDAAMGLDDTEDGGATSLEMSAAEGDELSDDEAVDENDPLEVFRRELWAKPGDWFVVHTYSGMENRVKSNLENRIISLNMEDYIHEIVVPTEEVAEIKNGQRKMVRRTVLPGYVLVRMDLTDESWAAVRHTPSVTGFVGHSHQPVPLSMSEVENMLAPAVVARAEAEAVAAGVPSVVRRSRREEAGRGRRLRRVRLGHGRRRSVRHAARDDHRDQRGVAAGQGPRRDLRPGDPGRAELQPDPEGLRP